MVIKVSGEKMCDVKWSNIAEVKGKVRLDALERYIQDLSRSRTRGLMVISLCWKEGSSISGLAGMKRVAKCYEEEERVGFVKLSPGVDLYVCPCSDTIITILAKHGFFKGMSAAVDNKDSLIGCVVKRKNGASTSSATEKSDSTNCSLPEQCLNSSFGSSNKKSAEKDLSSEQPIQTSIPIARETEISTLESQGNSGNEDKHLLSSEIQLGSCNSSASANLSLASSILRPETYSASNYARDSSSLKGSMSQSSEVEAPPIHKSRMKRPKLSFVPQKSVLSLPSEVTKQSTPTFDDLPEFDFGTAFGIFQTPKSVHAATIDKKLLNEGSRKMDGSMQPTEPTLQSLSTFNKQRPDFTFTVSPLNETQRMPLLNKVYEHEDAKTAQSRGIRMPVTATAVNSKNLCDDGDMPEWLPPNVELCKRSVPQVTYSSTISVPLKVPNSTTSIPLKVPNSVFGDFSFSNPRSSLVVPWITSPPITSGPLKVPISKFSSSFSDSRPSLFVPHITSLHPNSMFGSFSFGHPSSSRVAHPHCPNHAFPRANFCSIDTTVKAAPPRLPEGYVQRVPGSSMVFGANPLLRPPPSQFAVKLPVNPAGWRG